jgi:8-oxo-dGTP diphosphatase
MDHPQPWIAADCVVFDAKDRLLLIRRKNPPYQGQYALPGGFVELGETTEQAALRELKEETGISAARAKLIGVYSDPTRDPRHHVIGIAYLVEVGTPAPSAGDDAATAEFVSEWRNHTLAFDHNKVLLDAIRVKESL